MSGKLDADKVREAIGGDAEAQAALERILGRRDAYVRQVQAERDLGESNGMNSRGRRDGETSPRSAFRTTYCC